MAPDDSSSSGPGTPSRPTAATALDRVELAVEEAVDRATSAAERTAERHLGHHAVAVLAWTFKAIGLLLLFVYFAFALLYLGTRYWVMPRIDDYRPRIEAAVSKVLGAPVSVDRIETGWDGVNPTLRIRNMQLHDTAGGAALVLPELEATLSWASVPTMSPQFASIVVRAPELEVRRLPDNRFSIAGFVFDPAAPSTGNGGALDWVLAQRRIAVRDMRLRYIDESDPAGKQAGPVELQDGDFEYRRGLLTHRLAVRARAPSDLAGQLDVRMEFRHPPLARLSEFRRWTGRIFMQSDYADMGRLWSLLRLPTAGFDLRQGQGALRTWMNFDQMHVQRLTADVALADVDVRLARDRDPLQLAGVQGRLMLQELDNGSWKGGQEFAFTKFSLVAADGLSIPETTLRLRVAPLADVFDLGKGGENDARRGEFTASRARIETLLQLAEHAPLRPDLRQELLDRNLRGELFDTQITWDRPPQGDALRYTVQTRFTGLASRGREADPPTTRSGIPRPGLPGFTNLAGTLTANEAGGKVRIDTEDATLEFPGVFEAQRIPAAKLKVAVGWATQPKLELRFDTVEITSPDLEATASGLWRASKGPGYLDVTAHIARLSVPAAHVYSPLVLGGNVRNWLREAFTAGEAVDGTARLRGDLAEFPFINGNGEFLATTHVREAGIDYLSPTLAPNDPPAKTRWPVVANADGDLRVERNKLVFNGQRATVFDTKLEKIEVRIPELVGKEPHLQVALTANGTVADVLRFVNTSPVGGWLGHFLADTRAEGAATTDLRLDVPLKEAKATRVNGGIAMKGVDLNLLTELPPFANTTGRIEFTESSFHIANVTAGFVGGQLTVEGGSRPDGPITVTGSGTATPAGLRRLADIGVVQRALDKSQGTTRYAGTLTVRNGRTELHVESSLAGWSVDLPPPLQKTATEEWPSRFDIVPTAETSTSRSDRVRLFVANKIAVQVARRSDRNGPTRVTGSAVRVGRGTDADVESVPESGMRVLVDLPRLDVDRWTPFFTATASGAAGVERGAVAPPGSDMPNLIAGRVDQLIYSGKPMGNVVIGATRAAEGDDVLWLANIVSDNATGSVNWRMPRGDSPGRVSARLARLLIPENERTEMPEVFDTPAEEVAPALDIVVDSFELGTFKLGRLELVAQNTMPGVSSEWQLQRLEIANPDARMHATGRWYREPGAKRRTMALDMALEFNNAGRLLGRFGIADALKNGEGTLDAKINWVGGPLSLDYATLAGSLRLSANKGQFLKADAGAGRLLGVLSLQALPRRMTLDFRDVFSEGFAFDSITATANVAAGVLSTKDFKMRSANASVLIEGSSDLRAESQNLHVLVLPEVSATSASLAYALLANPAIGLGTFIAQLLLRDPLSKAFSFEYDVTGSWRDPVVKRRERVVPGATGQTALPGQEPQEPQAPSQAPAQPAPPPSPPSPPPASEPSPSPSK